MTCTWSKNTALDTTIEQALTDVLLLELSSQMALHKGGLPHSAVADKHTLEGGYVVGVLHFLFQRLPSSFFSEVSEV